MLLDILHGIEDETMFRYFAMVKMKSIPITNTWHFHNSLTIVLQVGQLVHGEALVWIFTWLSLVALYRDLCLDLIQAWKKKIWLSLYLEKR